MTNVLDRDRTIPPTEGPVGVLDRPETRELPPRAPLPPIAKRPFVRWMGWVVALVVVVGSGFVLFDRLSPAVGDGSYELNELNRMMQLAPEDISFEVNELSRVMAMAPAADTSVEMNELNRMTQLRPTADESFLENEVNRMFGLAPEPDTSFDTNEVTRMTQLAPPLSDAELIRITTLVR